MKFTKHIAFPLFNWLGNGRPNLRRKMSKDARFSIPLQYSTQLENSPALIYSLFLHR